MSANRIGQYLAALRYKRGLSLGELAGLVTGDQMTPRRRSKVAQRIIEIERIEARDDALARAVVASLGGDVQHLDELVRLDRADEVRAFETWLDEPVTPVFHMKALPGLWLTHRLPADIKSEDDAVAYVVTLSVGRPFTFLVEWTRRSRVSIRAGQVQARWEVTAYDALPHMSVRGRPFRFEAAE